MLNIIQCSKSSFSHILEAVSTRSCSSCCAMNECLQCCVLHEGALMGSGTFYSSCVSCINGVFPGHLT